MLTAILADDEPMILKGLEKLVNWQSLGVKIIATANDGLEALALIDLHQPDLLISDISMPKCSGIELLKILKEKDNDTKVIFISGYQEFDYARDALKYGALDYLIKPINEKQLITCIEKIVAESHKEHALLQQPVTLELYLNDDSTTRYIDDDIVKTQRHFIDKEGFYAVLCCALDDSQQLDADVKEIILFSTLNSIEDLVSHIDGHWIITKNDFIYILLYNQVLGEVEANLTTLPQTIVTSIKKATGQSTSIGTSKIIDDIGIIRSAFIMSNMSLQENYFYGKASVIHSTEGHPNKYTLEDYYKAQVVILDSIMAFDGEKIKRSVNYYMEIVKDVSLWDKKVAINYSLATLVFIQQHLSDSSIHLKKRNFDLIKETFEETSYYIELEHLMRQTCDDYLEEITNGANLQHNADITKVKTYIQEHYQESIKLETLADIVFMNPNYFSGYFKKHVGVKFKEYITNFRINEAEKLMLSTDYKVYEIAEAVGFGDYRHFSEVFKKVKGQSPSEYRKKIINQSKG